MDLLTIHHSLISFVEQTGVSHLRYMIFHVQQKNLCQAGAAARIEVKKFKETLMIESRHNCCVIQV